MAKAKTRRMTEVHSIAEIPPNMSEDEEHAFWSTHSLGEELLDLMGPAGEGELPPPRRERRWPRMRVLPLVLAAAGAMAYLAHKAGRIRR